MLKETETPKYGNNQFIQILNNQQAQMNQHSAMITKQFEMLNKQSIEITKLVSLISTKLEDDTDPYLLSTQTKPYEIVNEVKEKNDENKKD